MPSKPRKNYEPEFKSKVVKCAEELNNNSEAARRFGVNEKLVRDWRKKDMLSKTKPEHEEELARQGEEHVYMGYSIAQPAESVFEDEPEAAGPSTTMKGSSESNMILQQNWIQNAGGDEEYSLPSEESEQLPQSPMWTEPFDSEKENPPGACGPVPVPCAEQVTGTSDREVFEVEPSQASPPNGSSERLPDDYPGQGDEGCSNSDADDDCSVNELQTQLIRSLGDLDLDEENTSGACGSEAVPGTEQDTKTSDGEVGQGAAGLSTTMNGSSELNILQQNCIQNTGGDWERSLPQEESEQLPQSPMWTEPFDLGKYLKIYDTISPKLSNSPIPSSEEMEVFGTGENSGEENPSGACGPVSVSCAEQVTGTSDREETKTQEFVCTPDSCSTEGGCTFILKSNRGTLQPGDYYIRWDNYGVTDATSEGGKFVEGGDSRVPGATKPETHFISPQVFREGESEACGTFLFKYKSNVDKLLVADVVEGRSRKRKRLAFTPKACRSFSTSLPNVGLPSNDCPDGNSSEPVNCGDAGLFPFTEDMIYLAAEMGSFHYFDALLSFPFGTQLLKLTDGCPSIETAARENGHDDLADEIKEFMSVVQKDESFDVSKITVKRKDMINAILREKKMLEEKFDDSDDDVNVEEDHFNSNSTVSDNVLKDGSECLIEYEVLKTGEPRVDDELSVVDDEIREITVKLQDMIDAIVEEEKVEENYDDSDDNVNGEEDHFNSESSVSHSVLKAGPKCSIECTELETGSKNQDQTSDKKKTIIQNQEEADEKQQTIIPNSEEANEKQEAIIQNQKVANEKQQIVIQNQEEANEKQETIIHNQEEACGQQEIIIRNQEEANEKPDTIIQDQEEARENQEPIIQNQELPSGKQQPIIQAGENREKIIQKREEANEEQATLIQSKKEANEKQETIIQNQEDTGRKQEIIIQNQEEANEKQQTIIHNPEEANEKQETIIQNQEKASEKQETIIQNQKEANEKQEAIIQNEEEVNGKQETIIQNQEKASEEQEIIPQSQEAIIQNQEMANEKKETIIQNQKGANEKQETIIHNQEEASGKQEIIIQNQEVPSGKQQPIIPNQEEASEKQETIIQNEKEANEKQETILQNQEEPNEKQEKIIKNQEEVNEKQQTIIQNQEEPANEKQQTIIQNQKEANEKQETIIHNQEEANEKQEIITHNQEKANEKQETIIQNQEEANEKQQTIIPKQKEANEKQDTSIQNREEANEMQETILQNPEEANEKQETILQNEEEANEKQETIILNPKEANEKQETIIQNLKEANEKQETIIQNQEVASRKQEIIIRNQEEANEKPDTIIQNQDEARENQEPIIQNQEVPNGKQQPIIQAGENQERIIQKQEEANERLNIILIQTIIQNQEEAIGKKLPSLNQEEEVPSIQNLKDTPIPCSDENVVFSRASEDSENSEESIPTYDAIPPESSNSPTPSFAVLAKGRQQHEEIEARKRIPVFKTWRKQKRKQIMGRKTIYQDFIRNFETAEFDPESKVLTFHNWEQAAKAYADWRTKNKTKADPDVKKQKDALRSGKLKTAEFYPESKVLTFYNWEQAAKEYGDWRSEKKTTANANLIKQKYALRSALVFKNLAKQIYKTVENGVEMRKFRILSNDIALQLLSSQEEVAVCRDYSIGQPAVSGTASDIQKERDWKVLPYLRLLTQLRDVRSGVRRWGDLEAEQTIGSLGPLTQQRICKKLNIIRDVGGDFRDLALHFGMSCDELDLIKQQSDPTNKVLSWAARDPRNTIAKLREILEELGRLDCVEIIDKCHGPGKSKWGKDSLKISSEFLDCHGCCVGSLGLAVLRAGTKLMSNEDEDSRLLERTRPKHTVNYRNFEKAQQFSHTVFDLNEVSLADYIKSHDIEHLTFHGLRINRDILTGLQVLHCGQPVVLHINLKPENFLPDVEGHMRLGDFGISRKVNEANTTICTNHIMGTPVFMAPEVFKREDQGRGYSGKSDIYALGMIILDILTKRKYLFGDDVTSRDHNVVKGNAESLPLLTDPLAREFVPWWISHNKKDRPSAEEALQHKFISNKDEVTSETKMEKRRKERDQQERLEKEGKQREEQERLERERKQREEQERLKKERKQREEQEQLVKERKQREEQEQLEKENNVKN